MINYDKEKDQFTEGDREVFFMERDRALAKLYCGENRKLAHTVKTISMIVTGVIGTWVAWEVFVVWAWCNYIIPKNPITGAVAIRDLAQSFWFIVLGSFLARGTFEIARGPRPIRREIPETTDDPDQPVDPNPPRES